MKFDGKKIFANKNLETQLVTMEAEIGSHNK